MHPKWSTRESACVQINTTSCREIPSLLEHTAAVMQQPAQLVNLANAYININEVLHTSLVALLPSPLFQPFQNPSIPTHLMLLDI